MFAVVEIGGKQYKVAKGDVLSVDKLPGKEGETVTFTRVLLSKDNGKTNIGKPVVAGVKVTAKIRKQYKDEKISVRRYKSKVRYRKQTGFRAQLTELEITSIGRS